MAIKEHLVIIKQGVGAWNEWRKTNPEVKPNLEGADLVKFDLVGINLNKAYLNSARLNMSRLCAADLREANLFHAILNGADLSDANLTSAVLNGAYLSSTNLSKAQMSNTDLRSALFSNANLTKANLYQANLYFSNLFAANLAEAALIEANLYGTRLSWANLNGADFSRATVGWTEFGNADLSLAKGLDSVKHEGPSNIGIESFSRFKDTIPESFLRGTGVPDAWIELIPSFVSRLQTIQYFSCFVSYSHNDEEFAKRLYSRLRDENLRVWFAPEDIKAGKKIHDQIKEAIRYHDKLIVVLSEASMASEWVITEIYHARQREIEEKRQILFPIRLVDFEKIRRWRKLDADSGNDIARDIREYFIPNFSNWKNHDEFEKASARLLRDLKA